MLFDGHPEFRRMVWIVSVGKLMDDDILRNPRGQEDRLPVKGYVSYKTAYNLGSEFVDDKRVDGRAAKRALARWMNLHPTNVTQKVQFIMRHFTTNVAHLLDGKAKAMIVTSSRPAAVRFKKAVDEFIAAHPEHAGIKAMVAFSGKLTGKDVMHSKDERIAGGAFVCDDDAEFTEVNMNPDARGQDLRVAFDRPEYRIMTLRINSRPGSISQSLSQCISTRRSPMRWR